MVKAMWEGRFSKPLEQKTNDFNASLPIDARMYRADIQGSIAHAEMLGATGIIPAADAEKIVQGLDLILNEIESGAIRLSDYVGKAEDIHMLVEQLLTERIGDAGKKLHTARSRNDQVATDFRIYLKGGIGELKRYLWELISTISELAKQTADAVCPGYTHLQRAQPIHFSHQLLAYAEMFKRDFDRFSDAYRRTDVCPLGSAALAGTTYPIDRRMTAKLLGFREVAKNSIDAVSDRDFAADFLFASALTMTHLSRFAEEVIFWCSAECKYMELDDGYATGSSIMPQKKNPDVAELARGKTGRVYGDLFALLTVLKGLPLAYDKDMQEDKEAAFDALDTLEQCLPIFADMLKTARFLKENMLKAAETGFINATDVADYLTKKGVPFREAYKISGSLVKLCIAENTTLNGLPLARYREFSELFDRDLYDAISMRTAADQRNSEGGAGSLSQQIQIAELDRWLSENAVFEGCPEGLC